MLAAVAAAFANGIGGPFVFDDTQPRGPFSWRLRPLTWLSFELNRQLGGSDTWGYHLLNVLVHAATALLLLVFLRLALTLAAPALAARTRAGLALATVLIWAVHPLQTESVTYVSQRAESLASFFYLAFLYAYLRAVSAASTVNAGRAWRWQVVALGALVLGFASKELVATAPILAWILGAVLCARADTARRTSRGFTLALVLAWCALLFVFVVRPLFAASSTSGFGVREVTPLEYLRSQPGVLLHYLRLAVWPHPLCIDRAWPVAREWQEFVPQGLLVLALLALALRALLARAWIGLAGAWFFVILAPTSSFVPIKDLAVEHRTYLALASVALLAVLCGWRLCARLLPRARHAPAALAAAVVLALLAATVRRNRDYGSAIVLWQSVIDCDPNNPRAYENLSGPLIEAGRTDEAIAALNTVLRLAPSGLAYNNLAAIEMNAGRMDEAIATLTRAIVEDPSYDVSYSNLGSCYLRTGEAQRAVLYFQRALERLDSPYAHRGLATAYGELGNAAQAEAHFRRALELDPTDEVAQRGLAKLRARAPGG